MTEKELKEIESDLLIAQQYLKDGLIILANERLGYAINQIQVALY